ncbi:MAG: 6,7-dimethyl-8-ribityllumazine synthase [Tannerella sp.]|jgi:6,7-dimethyl-8-ribityllumazine synthase|nr:6,7-dimethyl-8-ribityllumazine synthase [Tannerella sp.]
MTTADLSLYDSVPDTSDMRFGIVVSDWNRVITGKLLEGAIDTLMKHGVLADDIEVFHVPGSFELIYGARQVIDQVDIDAVIVLGCVVRGGTPHFDYVCQGVTEGIANLNATQDIPVIFGLLTTDNMEQAYERAGGSLGNKGEEFAISAIKMIDFFCNLEK